MCNNTSPEHRDMLRMKSEARMNILKSIMRTRQPVRIHCNANEIILSNLFLWQIVIFLPGFLVATTRRQKSTEHRLLLNNE